MAISVAVIGSGVMGAGIAQVAAAAGHEVKLYDVRPEAVAKALGGLSTNFRRLVEKNRMSAEAAHAAISRVQPASAVDELADAKLVIEAVSEDLDLKKHLFTELERVVGDNCILATNTSSLSITAIAATLKQPGRVVGMHFFNPAPVMELVEVISGLTTDRACADVVFSIAAAWGKTPVHVKSTPGFIVNRVARPYYGEALRLVTENAASPASLDAVMRESGGFRMGPFELMDLIGHDVNFAVTRSIFDAYFGDPRFTPSLIQQELVRAGFLGRKSGRGFFEYGENASSPLPETEPIAPPPKKVVLSANSALGEALQQRLKKSEASFIDATAGDSMAADEAVIAITDGRTATERAHETGIRDLVLVDLALDYAGATRLALAKAEQCSTSAYASAVGLFQAAGYAITRIRDVPALAVMRTVAMLANEAADAVNQGVCTVDAVDTAMRKGVNYPIGPLTWADRIGITGICTVLTNLAKHYGEDRYRVSPLIRQLFWTGRTFRDLQAASLKHEI